jgi:hypothetical protein
MWLLSQTPSVRERNHAWKGGTTNRYGDYNGSKIQNTLNKPMSRKKCYILVKNIRAFASSPGHF